MASVTELWGGAVTMCALEGYDDASNFRPVPDHQEVWMHRSSGACVILELMARQGHVADEDSAKFFFEDLAKDNGATVSSVDATLPPQFLDWQSTAGPLRVAVQTLSGTQTVAKFNEKDGNVVYVALGVLRLPAPFTTEVLVTLSAPQQVAPTSSEARHVEAVMPAPVANQTVAAILESLRVVDWGLFVQEE